MRELAKPVEGDRIILAVHGAAVTASHPCRCSTVVSRAGFSAGVWCTGLAGVTVGPELT